MSKVCSRCTRELPVEAFYQNKASKDGLMSRCADCVKAYAAEYQRRPGSREKRRGRYWRNEEYRRSQATQKKAARDAARGGPPPPRPVSQKPHAETVRKAVKKYHSRPENKKKFRAQWAAQYAIKQGNLARLPCECCGARAQAHHDDYDKPLIVRWLCPVHHKAWHMEHGEGRNALEGI